jgi:ferredoxin-NADP reductase
MFACGVGITPLRALLEELRYPRGAATLIYRIRSNSEIIFRREIEELSRLRGVRVVYLPGPRADRPSWLPHGAAHLSDVVALHGLVPDLASHDVYICGPDPWMDLVHAAVDGVGVPAEQVHSERFTW